MFQPCAQPELIPFLYSSHSWFQILQLFPLIQSSSSEFCFPQCLMCRSSLHLHPNLISVNNLPCPSHPPPCPAFLTSSPIIAFKEAQLFFKGKFKKEQKFFIQLSCFSSFLPTLFPQGYGNFMGLPLMEEAGGLLFSHRGGESSISCHWHKCLILMQAELSHDGLLIIHCNRLWI